MKLIILILLVLILKNWWRCSFFNNLPNKNNNELKIQKIFEFFYFGKAKKSIRKINERKNLLSMEMVAKIDYNSQNSNNQNNIHNYNLLDDGSIKHNKTQSSNIIIDETSNCKNLLMWKMELKIILNKK